MGREGDPHGWHPPWCVVDHDEAGASARHEAEGVPIAVTLLEAQAGLPSRPTSAEVVAVLHHDGDGPWLYIGDGVRQHLGSAWTPGAGSLLSPTSSSTSTTHPRALVERLRPLLMSL